MRKNRKLLARQIDAEIEGLSVLAPGTEKKEKAVDDAAKLYRLEMEERMHDKECVVKILGYGVSIVSAIAVIGIECTRIRWAHEFETKNVITGGAYNEFGKVVDLILRKIKP